MLRWLALSLPLFVAGCRACNGGAGGGADAAPPRPTLSLVSARDHLEGAFTTSRALYADAQRIYLVSRWRPEIFVLARDRAAGFPLLETVAIAGAEPHAVRGDDRRVYVTCSDGTVRVYDKTTPLTPVAAWTISSLDLGDLELVGGKLWVSVGQTAVAVSPSGDATRVFMSAINEHNPVAEVSLETGAIGRAYGTTFEAFTIVAFDGATGARRGAVANPLDLRGNPSAVNLYADETTLFVTIPGCCGPSIHVLDAATLAERQVIARANVNAVVRRGRWLIAGNEGGQVEVYDLGSTPSPLVAAVDLRSATGHTGAEDIEIRGLWVDAVDSLVFAASSWGNDESRGPELPSFFVLELRD